MKKLFFLAMLSFGGYQFYKNGYSFTAPDGAFDKNGKPTVLLFVGPNCNEHCDGIRKALGNRGVPFGEIDLAGPDGRRQDNKYGVERYPTTLVGKVKVEGSDPMAVTSALAGGVGQ